MSLAPLSHPLATDSHPESSSARPRAGAPARSARASACAIAAAALATLGVAPAAYAGDTVRFARSKISAGDLRSAEAIVEDYRREHGVDRETLEALGWLARGALLLGERERALAYAAEVRGLAGAPDEENLLAIGAALEVEGRVRALVDGRGAALAHFRAALDLSPDSAFRSRMWKNVNLLELEGQPAPELGGFSDHLGPRPTPLAELGGRPVLLFFWAHWCGDCKSQAPAVARAAQRFASRGLAVVAPTRYYGTGKDGAEVTPAEEKVWIGEVLAASYPGFDSIPAPIDEATMVRYGASATPTFALVDRFGRVAFYAPTRLTEGELARRIEMVLAD